MRKRTIAAIAAVASCVVAMQANAEKWTGVQGGASDFLWLDLDSVRRDDASQLLVVRTNRPDDPKNPGGRDVQVGGPRMRFVDCAGRKVGFSPGRLESAPDTSDLAYLVDKTCSAPIGTGPVVASAAQSAPQAAAPAALATLAKGESPQHYTAGMQALFAGRAGDAANAFRAGAAIGDPGCALYLAVMNEYGQGMPKDRAQASTWLGAVVTDGRMLAARAMRYNFGHFMDMAKRGYPMAQFAVGLAYAENNDGEKPTGDMQQARATCRPWPCCRKWTGRARQEAVAAEATTTRRNRPCRSSTTPRWIH